LLILICFAACDRGDREILDPVVVRSTRLSATSTVNPALVIGYERTTTTDGQPVDERAVDTGNYPENLAELVQTGEPAPDGRTFAQSAGSFSDGKFVRTYEGIEVVTTVPRDPDQKKTNANNIHAASPPTSPAIDPALQARVASEPAETI